MIYELPQPGEIDSKLPVSFQIDDYPVQRIHGIKHLDRLHDLIPNFKCTVFAIPQQMDTDPDAWKPLIERREWIRAGIHGYNHEKNECRTKYGTPKHHEDRIRQILESGPWSRIAKSPWYASGWKYIEGCSRNGCAVCLDTRERAEEFAQYMAKKLRFFLIKGSSVCTSSTRHFGRKTCTSISRGTERLQAVVEASMGMVFCEDYTEWINGNTNVNINIGCWDHVLPGWINFDKHYLAPGVRQWAWDDPIPYADGVVEMALIQHVLMYCNKERYESNLSEIYRSLRSGGVLIVKEDDNRNFVWRELGTNHKTGTVLSTSNPPEMKDLLQKVGFIIEEDNPERIVANHGDIINRQRKLFKGICYALVARKP